MDSLEKLFPNILGETNEVHLLDIAVQNEILQTPEEFRFFEESSLQEKKIFVMGKAAVKECGVSGIYEILNTDAFEKSTSPVFKKKVRDVLEKNSANFTEAEVHHCARCVDLILKRPVR